MQQAKRGRLSREDSSVAGQALGELYTIGFSALVSSTASVVPQVEERS
ncbi:hypothetical protein [Pseudobacteriovorax antillogorgiicola]|nr:hypothetical protein [Pseudobacteriovorax antillogorgiicola]